MGPHNSKWNSSVKEYPDTYKWDLGDGNTTSSGCFPHCAYKEHPGSWVLFGHRR